MEFLMIVVFALMIIAMVSAILTMFSGDASQLEEIGINLGR